MHHLAPIRNGWLMGLVATLVSACGLNPQHVDLDLNRSLPEVKTTVFSEAVRQLGRANVIYGRGPIRIMSKPVRDNTGTSLPTKGEVPQDISEMVKSTLNSIGGEILYVPYDPEFMLNTARTGYSQWKDKLLPNVVLVGGLTEFDRGLVTKEEGVDASGSLEDVGTDIEIGLDFSDVRKSSLARITLDFNLLNFTTFTGIPFMQAVNTIRVHKGVGEDELGFTVYGQTLGVRGNIKKIQGRHAAIRLLVQLSVIQVVGKYQRLPYWRLLPNAEPDPVVLDAVREEFYTLQGPDRIARIQEYLYLSGQNVEVTGQLDDPTRNALENFKRAHGLGSAPSVSEAVYLALFENVPLGIETQLRRKQVNAMLTNYQQQKLALGQPVTPTPARKPSTPTPPAPQLGEVKVWMNKPAFQVGDSMEIFFEVTRPMFVRIVTVNSVGKISTLFPNPYQNNNYARPGKVYRIPPKGAPVTLTVGTPAGTDKIRAIASVTPLPADALPLTEQGEFTAGARQKFALAGTEFQVLTPSSSQAATAKGAQP